MPTPQPPAPRYGWLIRLVIAVLSGLLVTGAALESTLYQGATVAFPQSKTRSMLKQIAPVLEAYRKEEGAVPRSFQEVPLLQRQVLCDERGNPLDGWGNPFVYRVRGDRYEVVSYGADAKPGGVGADCDLSLDNPRPPESRPTFWQAYRAPEHQSMVVTGWVSGAVTCALTWWMLRRERFSRARLLAIGLKLIVTLMGAAMVAGILTMLHVPSGH